MALVEANQKPRQYYCPLGCETGDERLGGRLDSARGPDLKIVRTEMFSSLGHLLGHGASLSGARWCSSINNLWKRSMKVVCAIGLLTCFLGKCIHSHSKGWQTFAWWSGPGSCVRMLEMVVPEQVRGNSIFKQTKYLSWQKKGYPGGDGEPALHLRHGGRGAVLCQVVQGEPALSLDVSIHKSCRRMAMNFSATSPGTGSRGSQPSTCRASR